MDGGKPVNGDSTIEGSQSKRDGYDTGPSLHHVEQRYIRAG